MLDKLDWHFREEGFPENGSEIDAAVHIGFFIEWCIRSNIISEEFKEDNEDEIDELLTGEINGADLFLTALDGTFSEYDIDDKYQDFVNDYYGGNSKAQVGYLYDFKKIFSDYQPYTVPYTKDNYFKIASVINKNFENYRK